MRGSSTIKQDLRPTAIETPPCSLSGKTLGAAMRTLTNRFGNPDDSKSPAALRPLVAKVCPSLRLPSFGTDSNRLNGADHVIAKLRVNSARFGWLSTRPIIGCDNTRSTAR